MASVSPNCPLNPIRARQFWAFTDFRVPYLEMLQGWNPSTHKAVALSLSPVSKEARVQTAEPCRLPPPRPTAPFFALRAHLCSCFSLQPAVHKLRKRAFLPSCYSPELPLKSLARGLAADRHTTVTCVLELRLEHIFRREFPAQFEVLRAEIS